MQILPPPIEPSPCHPNRALTEMRSKEAGFNALSEAGRDGGQPQNEGSLIFRPKGGVRVPGWGVDSVRPCLVSGVLNQGEIWVSASLARVY